MKVTEEGIKKVVEAIANGNKEEVKNEEYWLDKEIKKHHYFNLRKPDHYASFVFNAVEEPLESLLENIIDDVYPNTEDTEGRDKLYFVFKNFDFVERHLERLIEKYEGSICVNDKTSYLIFSYVYHIRTGTTPTSIQFEYGKFFCPHRGTPEEWFAFIDSMHDLMYGDSDKYFETKKCLVDMYKSEEKFYSPS